MRPWRVWWQSQESYSPCAQHIYTDSASSIACAPATVCVQAGAVHKVSGLPRLKQRTHSLCKVTAKLLKDHFLSMECQEPPLQLSEAPASVPGARAFSGLQSRKRIASVHSSCVPLPFSREKVACRLAHWSQCVLPAACGQRGARSQVRNQKISVIDDRRLQVCSRTCSLAQLACSEM